MARRKGKGAGKGRDPSGNKITPKAIRDPKDPELRTMKIRDPRDYETGMTVKSQKTEKEQG